jgi:Flp pilus assembly protein TadG
MENAVTVAKPRWYALLGRFRKNKRGSVAIEFGLLFPIFIAFMGITIETGLIFFKEYAIQAGVQNVSRAIRTGVAQENGWTVATFRDEICESAAIVSDCQSKLKVFVDSNTSFSTIRSSAPNFSSVGADEDGADQNLSWDCGGAQQVVAVIATYDHRFMIPGMNLIWANTSNTRNRRLSGFTMFRNEPFPAATTCSNAS